MASLGFYATVGDHQALLVDLFQQGDVRIFESYSAFDCDLKEFARPEQILDELRQATYPRLAVLLELWAPQASAEVGIERFEVSVAGHRYRHRIGGWGLMQLHLSKETEDTIHVSHFGHFSQRGAERRSEPPLSPPSNPGTAADWDWRLLAQISRRIQYRIAKRFSDKKVGSRPLLHEAAKLRQRGYRLALN
jgi:hypothetical protein